METDAAVMVPVADNDATVIEELFGKLRSDEIAPHSTCVGTLTVNPVTVIDVSGAE